MELSLKPIPGHTKVTPSYETTQFPSKPRRFALTGMKEISVSCNQETSWVLQVIFCSSQLSPITRTKASPWLLVCLVLSLASFQTLGPKELAGCPLPCWKDCNSHAREAPAHTDETFQQWAHQP